jgi:hypothetical protein
MYLTLLLPLVIPYGTPWTAHNPRAHFLRKAKFFRWKETVKNKQYQQVQLLFSKDIVNHRAGFIEGEQNPIQKIVPFNVTV